MKFGPKYVELKFEFMSTLNDKKRYTLAISVTSETVVYVYAS